MHGNLATGGDGSDGLRLVGGTLAFAASSLGDGCKPGNASLVSLGGNAQCSGTPSRALQAADVGLLGAAEVAATQAAYGGRVDMIGFAPGTSKLEDRLRAAA